MILPSQAIRALCENTKKPMIFPFLAKKAVMHGKSFGLSSAGYDIRIKEEITLYPNTLKYIILRALGFNYPNVALASTLERFDIPDDIMPKVEDKSSWAREFLSVFNTTAEPGWKGYLTVELKYSGTRPITIAAWSPIAQMIFHRLESPTEMPYKGKYQDQPDHPVHAIHEEG